MDEKSTWIKLLIDFYDHFLVKMRTVFVKVGMNFIPTDKNSISGLNCTLRRWMTSAKTWKNSHCKRNLLFTATNYQFLDELVSKQTFLVRKIASGSWEWSCEKDLGEKNFDQKVAPYPVMNPCPNTLNLPKWEKSGVITLTVGTRLFLRACKFRKVGLNFIPRKKLVWSSYLGMKFIPTNKNIFDPSLILTTHSSHCRTTSYPDQTRCEESNGTIVITPISLLHPHPDTLTLSHTLRVTINILTFWNHKIICFINVIIDRVNNREIESFCQPGWWLVWENHKI